jgi:hypothetical protein
MLIPNKFNGYSRDGRRLLSFNLGGGGGGGTTQTTSTVQNTNIPEYAKGYVENMLGATQKQLFNTSQVQTGTDESGNAIYGTQIDSFKPYQAYGGTYDAQGNQLSYDPGKAIAGFSPMQQAAQQGIGAMTMPTGDYANANWAIQHAGLGADQSAQEAYKYGREGSRSGALGQQLGIAGGQLGIQGGAQYGQMGAGYGNQAAGLAGTALNYGQGAADIGQMALRAQDTGNQIGAQAQDYARQAAAAGQNYANQATNANAMQQYMSPYMQNMVDVQNREAMRNAGIMGTQQQAEATKAGAFGGGRDAIMRAERERNLSTLMNQNQAQGLQSAYQQAQQAQQFGANLGLQGLSGAQQGLGTALQGGQLGLSGIGQALAGQQGALAGVGAANQAYQTGIQGANTGLQGVNTQLAGVDRQLAGTAQGMQGAQIGLQGVQGAQAGYGLLGQQGMNLTNMLGQQQQNQLSLYGAQNTAGAQQQALEQAKINQAMQDYANAQQYPLMQLGTMSNMLRGLPMQASTTNQYAASPNPLSQAVGTIGAGASIYNAMKAEGGVIKGYAKGGIMSYDMGGEVESQLESMDEKGLAEQAKTSSSPSIRKMAQRILRERQMSKAPQGADAANVQYQAAQPEMPSYKPGGIVAFGGGGETGEETAGEAEAKAPDTSGKTMEQRLAMAAPTTPATGIMAAAPVTQVATPSRAVQAMQPAAMPEWMKQQYAEVAADVSKPLAERVAEEVALRKSMGIADVAEGQQEQRKNLMTEKANAADEAARQRSMRMAEFFAKWGSTPGPVLVAGLNAMKESVPTLISDKKEEKKANREIDKSIADIDNATRAEKLGQMGRAMDLREKAIDRMKALQTSFVTYQAHKESNEKSVEVANINAAANAEHARIMAASHGATSKAADKRADETIRYHMQQDTLAKKKAVEGIDATIAKEAKDALDYKTAKRQVSLTRGVDKKERENAQAIVDKYESDWKARKSAAKDEFELAKNQLDEMNTKLGYSKKTESANTPSTATTPAPAAAAPSVTIGGQTFTKPDNMTAAQWDAYKKSQGVK